MDATARAAPRVNLKIAAPILLVLLVVAIYARSWQGEFLNYDDDYNLTANPHFRGFTVENLKWMFTNHYGHYIPVTWLSFAVDYTLWGMNPFGYRCVNTLLHAVNAILVWLVLRELLRRAKPEAGQGRIDAASLVGALFFAVHPLRVASVAWITERRDMVSGLFFLLTILFYLRRASPSGSPGRRWLALSVGSFALMVFSKALGITLPVVFLLLDVWPLRRFSREKVAALFVEKIPFFALMAVGLALTSWAQRTADAMYSREQYPLVQSLVQPGFRVSFYVWKTLVPIHLSPLYLYRPELGGVHVLGWMFVAGVSAAAIALRRRAPALLLAWLSYGLFISPVSGVFQAGPHYAHDIWSYLPCLPLAALAAAAMLLPLRGAVLGASAAAMVATFSVQSFVQTPVWMTSLALWDAALRRDPDAYFSWYQRGRAKAERDDLDGAIGDFGRAIELRSGFPDPWHHRGLAWMKKDRPDLASADFDVVLRIDPARSGTWLQLGLAKLRMRQPAEARKCFDRAIELRPEFPEALSQRGRLRALQGDPRSGLRDLDEAVRIAPQALLFLERAAIRGLLSDWDGIVADCSEAIRLKPDFADAWAHRGHARLQRGDKPGAGQDLMRALELAPPGWPGRKETEELLRTSRKP